MNTPEALKVLQLYLKPSIFHLAFVINNTKTSCKSYFLSARIYMIYMERKHANNDCLL